MSAAKSSEFSPEQHVVIEVLRATGTVDPEHVEATAQDGVLTIGAVSMPGSAPSTGCRSYAP